MLKRIARRAGVNGFSIGFMSGLGLVVGHDGASLHRPEATAVPMLRPSVARFAIEAPGFRAICGT